MMMMMMMMSCHDGDWKDYITFCQILNKEDISLHKNRDSIREVMIKILIIAINHDHHHRHHHHRYHHHCHYHLLSSSQRLLRETEAATEDCAGNWKNSQHRWKEYDGDLYDDNSLWRLWCDEKSHTNQAKKVNNCREKMNITDKHDQCSTPGSWAWSKTWRKRRCHDHPEAGCSDAF